jgi:hypothetical protein
MAKDIATTCYDCGKEIEGRVEICISILDGTVRCCRCAKKIEEEMEIDKNRG